MLPLSPKQFVLKSEVVVDAEESSFSQKMALMKRMNQFFTEFTLTSVSFTNHLYLLEPFLFQQRSITKLTIEGDISSPPLMNRISSLAAKCEHLKEILLVQTTSFPTLSPETNFYWVEALKDNFHLNKVRIERAILPTNYLVLPEDLVPPKDLLLSDLALPNDLDLLKRYLIAFTRFRIKRPNFDILEILPRSKPNPSKYPYLLEDLIKTWDKIPPELRNSKIYAKYPHLLNVLVKIPELGISKIDAAKNPASKVAKACLELVYNESLQMPLSRKFQILFVAQPFLKSELPLLNFTGRSGKQYPVLKIAYDYFCERKLISSSPIDCSLYSDDALRTFTFMLNHGREIWNLSYYNFLEVLSLAIKFQSREFIHTIYKRFHSNFLEIVRDIQTISIDPKDPFLSSFQIIPDRTPNLENFLSFCYCYNIGALTIIYDQGLHYIKVHNIFSHISLTKALEFIYEESCISMLQLRWNNELELNCDQIKVKHRSAPQCFELTIESVINTDSPLFNYLKTTTDIDKISLIFQPDIKSLLKPKINQSALRIATEIVKSNPAIHKIIISEPNLQPVVLENFGKAVSESTTIEEIAISYEVRFSNRSLMKNNRWDLFFSHLIKSRKLEVISITHIIDLKNPSVCKQLCNVAKANNSLNRIELIVNGNLSIDVVTMLWDSVTSRKTKNLQIILLVTNPYSELDLVEIQEFIEQRSKNGFDWVQVEFL